MEAGRGSQACTFSEKGGEEMGSLSWIALFLPRCHKSSDTPSTEVIPLWEDRASSKGTSCSPQALNPGEAGVLMFLVLVCLVDAVTNPPEPRQGSFKKGLRSLQME